MDEKRQEALRETRARERERKGFLPKKYPRSIAVGCIKYELPPGEITEESQKAWESMWGMLGERELNGKLLQDEKGREVPAPEMVELFHDRGSPLKIVMNPGTEDEVSAHFYIRGVSFGD